MSMAVRWLRSGWLVLLLAFCMGGVSEARAGRVRVAVLPLMIHSLENVDHLQSGLMEMLASRVARLTNIEMLRFDDTSLATTNPAVARAAARRLGAQRSGIRRGIQCAGPGVGTPHASCPRPAPTRDRRTESQTPPRAARGPP